MKSPAELTDDDLLALAARAAALPDAPRHRIAAAMAMWQQRPQPLLRRILALLTFDSAATPPLALGMRAATGPAGVRHLLFSAEGRDVDLRIHAEGAAWVLQGQILGPDESGTVELDSPGGGHRADLDDLGAFRFDALPAGDYALTLRTAQALVELPTITVGRTTP